MKKILLLFIAVFLLLGCNSPSPAPILIPLSEKTNDELAYLLATYEDSSNATSEYPLYEILDEIKRRGSSASMIAPVLARMIAFNGSTSVTASEPLVAMRSSAKIAIPYLLQNLTNPREDVRRYSIFVLGSIGVAAKCTIPHLAPFLWDPDATVRSATAGALTEITKLELVEDDLYKLDFTAVGSVVVDEPEGHVTGIARNWWKEDGQTMNWPLEYCELPK